MVIMSILTEGAFRFWLSIIVVITLLWILIRFRAKGNNPKTSLVILKDRLEKGEITQEEFEEARKMQERR